MAAIIAIPLGLLLGWYPRARYALDPFVTFLYAMFSTSAMGVHGVIEFPNRLLGIVLFVVAVACFVAAWQQKPRRRRQVRLSVKAARPR